MKVTDKLIASIDKKLERFDPLWQAENGVGGLRSRYYDKTGVAKWREWRGVKDTFYDYTQWLNNLVSMVQMVASAPIPCLKGFWEYRWMGSYLGTFMFIDRLFEGYRGKELRIAHMNMHAIVQSLTKRIAFALKNDKRLGGGPDSDNIVPMDEVIPALIMKGFKGLTGFPLQTLPEFIICDVDQHIEPYYIDVAESFGLPADVCSRCSAETGVALDDAFPIFGKAFVTTNMPCNASEATSMFQRRRVALPDYAVTLAMQHTEPEAIPYSRAVLEEMIAFVEKEYGVKYDWNELFKYAELFNEQNTIELEKWDFFKTPYSPLSGIAESLYKLYEWQSVNGQDPYFNKVDRKVIEIMRKAYEEKYVPFGGKTRHRAFLWGTLRRLLHRLPDLGAELLGHHYCAEHGLHHGLQHDRHARPRQGDGRPDRNDAARMHAPSRRRRLGQRQRRLGVGEELQLRHGPHERQHRLQGYARRARPHGGAGARPRLPLHLH